MESTVDRASVIGVVGLGYVGLPVAVAFAKKFRVVGYDLSDEKLRSYKSGTDPTGEVGGEELRAAKLLEFTSDASHLGEADFIIVAVPTPVDNTHKPNFDPLIGASETIGRHMKRGATVVFESTVYPGATEEVCIPVLERESRMKWKTDFSVGYSPERINPGDREHTFTKILKIVSGDTPETLERVASLYASVVTAGVHKAPSIKVAEAAKIIENSQRDINIALMNELSVIFDRMGIDTTEVLRAAATKWNFLPFRPGLVGGHCIGVDPYYLTHKAEMMGYYPDVILAGRQINDGMGKFIAEKTVKLMIAAGSPIKGARVNVLGVTFKEDCPDLRNSRVVDIVFELRSYGVDVFVHDPVASAGAARHEYGIELFDWDRLPQADAVVFAVAHRAFRGMAVDKLVPKVKSGGCVVDVKSILDPEALRSAGYSFWRL